MITRATLIALGDNPLRHLMTSVKGAYVLVASLHFIGLTILVGAMLLVDLRLLGVLNGFSYATALKFVRLAILGLAINVVSGLCLLATRPPILMNPAFALKISLVLIAAANACWFDLSARRRIVGLSDTASPGAAARVMAGASLLLWLGVIVTGRFLPLF